MTMTRALSSVSQRTMRPATSRREDGDDDRQQQSKSKTTTPFATIIIPMLLMMMASLFTILPLVEARAILGVDMGSLYMKVALVQSGSPLEIVVNQHSKRKTEQLILFDTAAKGQRFYGSDAQSLLAKKSHLTPAAMSVMLGRDDEHPIVKTLAERHYPLLPSHNSSRYGVTIDVEGRSFSPEELVAMVLSHAVDISIAHAVSTSGKPMTSISDVVLTVPSYATEHERRALIDAAAVAQLNVLGLVDETVAAAIHYAMDKTFADGKQTFLFYNMGAASVQCVVVAFDQVQHKTSKFGAAKPAPSVTVLGKAWDMTTGGTTFDHLIVEYLAEQFNHQWNHKLGLKGDAQKDIMTAPKNTRALTKLRIQANKIKHVLSANTEFPVYMDSLFDDTALSTKMTRETLEQLAAGAIERAVQPIFDCLKRANTTLDELTAIELIGGGMRIPAVQAGIKKALESAAKQVPAEKLTTGNLELGMHMNADESAALGAAFFGANVSTAFRVRHVGLTEISPWPVQITLQNLPPGSVVDDTDEADDSKDGGGGLFGFGKMKKKDGDSESDGDKKDESGSDESSSAEQQKERKATEASDSAKDDKADGAEEDDEEWGKHAIIFKSQTKIGIKKTIAFTHDKDVACALDYDISDKTPGAIALPQGTEAALTRYNITGIADFVKDFKEKGVLSGDKKPKVSLQFELDMMGITSLVKAEVAVEELVTVQEEVEVDDDEDDTNSTANATAADGEEEEAAKTEDTEATETTADAEDDSDATTANTTDETSNATSADELNATTAENATVTKKKKKRVLVEKEKKKVHRRTLKVSTYHIGRVRPLTPELLQESREKLVDMAAKDKERMMLEESRNRVESYIYHIKNKLTDEAETIDKVSTEKQREEARKHAEDAEEWLYDDGYKADLATMEDKYAELSEPFEKIKLRVSETKDLPAALEKAKKKLTEIEAKVGKWETDKPQITEEERAKVLEQLTNVRAGLEEKEAEQAKKKPHEEPVLVSADIPPEFKVLDAMVKLLQKKPKPKPEKKTSNATATGDNSTTGENATSSDAGEGDADATTTADEDDATKSSEEDAADATEGSSSEAETDEKEKDAEGEADAESEKDGDEEL